MPTFIHGKGTAVYLDEFVMTPYFNSTDVTLTNETAEVTSFADSSRAYIQLLDFQPGRRRIHDHRRLSRH